MKNVKLLLVAAAALISASSMAKMVQPGVLASEDAPIRLTGALNTSLVSPSTGFGFNNMSGGLGFSQNLGMDLEWGLEVGAGYAGTDLIESSRIFNESEKAGAGFRLDVELMTRFMPEVAEDFRFGAVVGLGWGKSFGVESPLKDKVAFGDLALRVGPALSYGLTDMVSFYFSAEYTLTNIRFASSSANDGEKKMISEHSNLSGMQLPLGFTVQASDNVGIFVEANTKFRDFRNFTKSWKEEITLGLSFAM